MKERCLPASRAGLKGILREMEVPFFDPLLIIEKTMQTDIYALTEFSPRKGENISKGYLQGRYGAIPFIGGNAAWAE